MVPERRAPAPAQEREGEVQEKGQRQKRENGDRPAKRDRRRLKPADEEREERQRGGQRPAEIVEHLPTGDGGQPPRPPRRAPEDPRQELPVAPDPAMLPHRRDVAARRMGFDQFNIRHEGRPREASLEEIVAQHRVLERSAGERRDEGVDVVDALAGIGALPEEILIDVRYGGRIHVDPALSGMDTLKDRALGAQRQGERDPRLQDAVAACHPLERSVEARAVQRMRDLPDQSLDRVPQKPRVAVEGQDEADVAWRGMRRDEACVSRSTEQPVQFGQLPALPLPSHPDPHRRVPGGVGDAGKGTDLRFPTDMLR